MLGGAPTSGQGENWSETNMAVPKIVRSTPVIVDLDDPPAGHRLTELLQALTGCSIERAELAISDPTPAGPACPEAALTSMARAMVALKSRSDVEPDGGYAPE